jgi:hypothetical protein
MSTAKKPKKPHIFFAGQKALCQKGEDGLPTLESLIALTKYLTGRDPTPIEIAQAQAIWDAIRKGGGHLGRPGEVAAVIMELDLEGIRREVDEKIGPGEATKMSFAFQMHDLEQKFAATAAVDGDVYLPNFTPSGPVDAVLIGMEPSLGWWARTPAEATAKIAAGFRNFMWSPEDFILHYTARRFLCSAGETYHITDISKGAMTVEKAHIDRRARYARWAVLLDEELRLIAKPDAHIIAIGRDVSVFLKRHGPDRDVARIVHYSAQANAARNAAVIGREAEFRAFSERLSMQHIVDVAEEIMRENAIPAAMSAETMARIQKAKLSESRKKLAFIYSTVFAKLRVA